MAPPRQSDPPVDPADRIASAGLIGLWLIPLLVVALSPVRLPGVDGFAANLWHLACLFPDRQTVWISTHYQVQVGDGGAWVTVPNDSLSRLKPFGYRSRLDRIVEEGVLRSTDPQRLLADIAGYVRDRVHAMRPDPPPVRRVRIFFIARLAGEELLEAGGPWAPANPATTDPSLYTVLLVREFPD